MGNKAQAYTEELLRFISESPTAFHTVESISRELEAHGFVELKESQKWTLEAGKNYYLTRNQSSILAFRVPTDQPSGYMIAASHTDSPTFKLKQNHLCPTGSYVKLATEVYGGTILSSWLDRPLSLAGRVVLCENNRIFTKNVKIDTDLLLIPNVSIHFNRTVNNGYTYNPAVDMQPLFAQKGSAEQSLKELISKELSCSVSQIVGMELFVYSRTAGTVWGLNHEFFSAPRIDNLMCAYATMVGFLNSPQPRHTVSVYYAADNEETGSSTKQGAASVMMSDALARVADSLGCDKRLLLADSMMVSADNAHAIHPNHPELSDGLNAPQMNGGVVIKNNASQKYATDSVSSTIFEEICKQATVPVQFFHNRSDMAGGSTLGSISNTQIPLLTVDIGMAQLAMHSSYETAGTQDTEHLIDAIKAFYSSRLICEKDGCYHLEFYPEQEGH
ncbi:MAG: M18 family aminopeptidase [Ruminococcaceae bacterium]|nr:M18 family aminopeptidase [Oscillospiraceae bacterium]